MTALHDATSTSARLRAQWEHTEALEMELGFQRMARSAAEERVAELEEQLPAARAAEDLWRTLAIRDRLTGLYNRTWLELLADLAETSALIMLDLNGFKLVNDAFTHHVGDLLLAAVGARLATIGWATAVRTGGDEFVLLVRRGCYPSAAALAWLAQQLNTPYRVGCRELQVSAAIGYTSVSDGDTLVDLLRRVDEAMYASKRSTPVAPVCWSPQLRTEPTDGGRRAYRDAGTA